MLTEHTKAPNFSAQDQFGELHNLEKYTHKWLLIYFYPKDNTPGCTVEACSIKNAWSDFQDAHITVLGVSADSVKSHLSFSEKYSLPFPLLSDSDKTMIKSYKALGLKKMFGREYEGILRISYLIAPDGTIAKAYPKVKPQDHAEEILRDVQELIS